MLPKGIYSIRAGFNETFHKKFYHIRDMFKKVTAYNESMNYKPNTDRQPPFHIYQELSLSNHSYLLKMAE